MADFQVEVVEFLIERGGRKELQLLPVRAHVGVHTAAAVGLEVWAYVAEGVTGVVRIHATTETKLHGTKRR